jgi:Flp pilus assembly pilin Flp
VAHRASNRPVRNGIAMLMLLKRLIVEQDGQDLIEYALLTGAIGFAGAVAFDALGDAINSTYTSWDTSVNDLWEVPNPE